MNPTEQVLLVSEFMRALAPVIAKYSMDCHREGGTTADRRELAAANAQLTLEFSMHLAGAFANFRDEALKGTQAQDSLETYSIDQALQREAAPAGDGL